MSRSPVSVCCGTGCCSSGNRLVSVDVIYRSKDIYKIGLDQLCTFVSLSLNVTGLVADISHVVIIDSTGLVGL